jgi:cyclic pyranopterin phosphate synthase
MKLSHINTRGEVRMVDVSGKAETHRVAIARALVAMEPATLEMLKAGALKKGDALAQARVAGIMAAKRTWELIPLCHPLSLTEVSIEFNFFDETGEVEIIASVSCTGRTGVEMEALTGASVAALAIYDMIKAVERGACIREVQLLKKSGGKSGEYSR